MTSARTRIVLAVLAGCSPSQDGDASTGPAVSSEGSDGGELSISAAVSYSETGDSSSDGDGSSDADASGSSAEASSSGEPVPPIPTGVWTRLDPGGAGPYFPYFYRSVPIGNGDVWLGWGTPASEGGNFLFSAVDNVWVRTNEAESDPTKNIGSRENYGASYDGERDCIWIGDGTPVAYGNPEGAQSGDLKYDIASDTFTLAYPNYGPPPNSIGRADAALLYHADALYVLGGWSVGPGQRLVRRDLLSEAVTEIAVSSTPPFTQEVARLTYARSGVDARTGIIWALVDDGALYTIDPVSDSPQWVHVPTTGDGPGSHHYVAALHEDADMIVAWMGRDGMASVEMPEVGSTLLLDLQTHVWSAGPSLAAGDAVPKSELMSANVMSYDAANARIVMTVGGDFVQVWAFTPDP